MTDLRVRAVEAVRYTREEETFAATSFADRTVTEEPLEVRIEHRGANTSVAVTMRTPGDDLALAAGFLFTEGIIEAPEDLIEIKTCREEGPDGDPVENVVQALLRPDHPFDPERFRRNVYTSSSCGVCGKASIDAVAVACEPVRVTPGLVGAQVLASLPGRLRDAQSVFQTTGGLHATALVDREGRIRTVREDVGRHNAMDKVLGRGFLDGDLPYHDHLLMVSGRVSFELVQKAARAGVPLLAAIGAPSSLALETADRLGLTVVGFLSPDRFNVYTHPERIRQGPSRQ